MVTSRERRQALNPRAYVERDDDDASRIVGLGPTKEKDWEDIWVEKKRRIISAEVQQRT